MNDASADAIVRLLAPRTVLAAGSHRAAVVTALRARGVHVDEVNLGDNSATPVRPDLAICIGAPDPAVTDVVPLVEVLSTGDSVLISIGGLEGQGDGAGAEHRADWARLFAEHGLFLDLDHDAAYLAPDAVLFRREAASSADLVQRYERALHDLRSRSHADITRLEAEVHQLRKEVLRTRDVAFGRQAELASAQARVEQLTSHLARYDNLEQRLHEVLNSRSWRAAQAVGLPIRMMRQRR